MLNRVTLKSLMIELLEVLEKHAELETNIGSNAGRAAISKDFIDRLVEIKPVNMDDIDE